MRFSILTSLSLVAFSFSASAAPVPVAKALAQPQLDILRGGILSGGVLSGNSASADGNTISGEQSILLHLTSRSSSDLRASFFQTTAPETLLEITTAMQTLQAMQTLPATPTPLQRLAMVSLVAPETLSVYAWVEQSQSLC
jgi:hypothetical protein